MRQAFLQLYTADADDEGKLKDARKSSSRINTKFREHSWIYLPDGKTIYFTMQ
jgi:hypothetical protein